jgi:hypothetical protein
MSSLYRAFVDLLPSDPLMVALVVDHNDDGTSTVQFPNGAVLRVRGQDVAIDAYAFIKSGEIRGEAPAVSPITLEV